MNDRWTMNATARTDFVWLWTCTELYRKHLPWSRAKYRKLLTVVFDLIFDFLKGRVGEGALPAQSNWASRKDSLCPQSFCDGEVACFPHRLPRKGDSPETGKDLISKWFAN